MCHLVYKYRLMINKIISEKTWAKMNIIIYSIFNPVFNYITLSIRIAITFTFNSIFIVIKMN